MMKALTATVAGLALLGQAAVAAAAPAASANAASRLSLSSAAAPARAGATTGKSSRLAGASIVPLVLLAGIVVGGVLIATDDDSDSD